MEDAENRRSEDRLQLFTLEMSRLGRRRGRISIWEIVEGGVSE